MFYNMISAYFLLAYAFYQALSKVQSKEFKKKLMFNFLMYFCEFFCSTDVS